METKIMAVFTLGPYPESVGSYQQPSNLLIYSLFLSGLYLRPKTQVTT
jgi:hypothetical protein